MKSFDCAQEPSFDAMPKRPEQGNTPAAYLLHLEAAGYSKATVRQTRHMLNFFFNWLTGRKITEPAREDISKYQDFIFAHRQKNGRPFAVCVQRGYLTSVRNFYQWQCDNALRLINPALAIELPRLSHALPGMTVNENKIERIIAGVSLKKIIGVRNRSILELLFATGMRTGEVRRLKIKDVDFDNKRIAIRESKGLKDRVIPVSRRALFWLKYYLQNVRARLLKRRRSGYVYVTSYTNQLSATETTTLVRDIFKKAGLAGNLRLMRHSYATILLENGMDIRHIQELLGHKKLETTEIYTHVSIGRLKDVHRKTHPRENAPD